MGRIDIMEKRKDKNHPKNDQSLVSPLLLARRMDIRSLYNYNEDVYVARLDKYNLNPWIKGSPPRLSATNDSVLIYGQDENKKKHAVRTDQAGRVKVDTIEFVNIEEDISVDECPVVSGSFDVSELKTYTFAVINYSCCNIQVQLQISPDNLHFYNEGIVEEILPHDINVMVPKRFLKYVRLLFISTRKNNHAVLKVYLQGQR